jgi:hypothetical protein
MLGRNEMKPGEHKYYFRKPRSEIAKDIFSLLLVTGAVTIAATSPYFVQNLLKGYRSGKSILGEKFSILFMN